MEAATGMGVPTIGPLTATTVASAAAQHGGYIAVTSENRHAFELTVVTNASSREAGEHAIALTGHSIRDAFRSLRRGLRRELLGIHTYTRHSLHDRRQSDKPSICCSPKRQYRRGSPPLLHLRSRSGWRRRAPL